MTLTDFFKENPKAAVAFSGGVDSAYLLSAAVSCSVDVTAYYAKTSFQPQFELDDARKLAEELGAKLRIIPIDILASPDIRNNPADRCYYCKRAMLSAIISAAQEDGYSLLLDGTNASDDADDRPGMTALKELSVRSPLRECGLTKPEIRRLSREANLFTWNKPAYACLATRIPCDTVITEDALAKTEAAEAFLSSMGFSDFRARLRGDSALLQFSADQLKKAFSQEETISNELKKYYSSVTIDPEARK